MVHHLKGFRRLRRHLHYWINKTTPSVTCGDSSLEREPRPFASLSRKAKGGGCPTYFSEKPVETDILKDIVRDAQWAPSWANAQPWKVYIAIGETAKTIRQFSSSQVELFKAPVIAYLTMHKNAPAWSVYDMGAFGQSLMLAAQDRGVDSIVASEYVKYPDYIHQIMGIPDDEAVVMAIGLGYADDSHINAFSLGENTTSPRQKAWKDVSKNS